MQERRVRPLISELATPTVGARILQGLWSWTYPAASVFWRPVTGHLEGNRISGYYARTWAGDSFLLFGSLSTQLDKRLDPASFLAIIPISEYAYLRYRSIALKKAIQRTAMCLERSRSLPACASGVMTRVICVDGWGSVGSVSSGYRLAG